MISINLFELGINQTDFNFLMGLTALLICFCLFQLVILVLSKME